MSRLLRLLPRGGVYRGWRCRKDRGRPRWPTQQGWRVPQVPLAAPDALQPAPRAAPHEARGPARREQVGGHQLGGGHRPGQYPDCNRHREVRPLLILACPWRWWSLHRVGDRHDRLHVWRVQLACQRRLPVRHAARLRDALRRGFQLLRRHGPRRALDGRCGRFRVDRGPQGRHRARFCALGKSAPLVQSRPRWSQLGGRAHQLGREDCRHRPLYDG